jgi:hypothetical protein
MQHNSEEVETLTGQEVSEVQQITTEYQQIGNTMRNTTAEFRVNSCQIIIVKSFDINLSGLQYQFRKLTLTILTLENVFTIQK